MKKITYLQLVLVHIGIGLVVYNFRPSAKFILFAAIIYFLFRIISNTNKKDEVLLAAGYITGFEVFSRMTGGAFSYEFAKYAVIMFLTIGMFYRGFKRKSWIYALYLLMLVPGILFSAINLDYESSVANAVGFNLSGPVCLGISALYCYDRRMPLSRLNDILLSVLLPIVSMTVYLYLYTPSIRDVLTGTQSNFEASGGFGPNQVATILGLAMVILFTRLFLKKQLLLNLIDLGLLAFISYRAIVTFSRGGVITAAICALAFFVLYFYRSKTSTKAWLVPRISVVTVVVIVTWFFTSFSTSGLIDKRYANQDAAGREKSDLSTGRLELLDSELQAFYEQPITGIGVGKVKEFRAEKTGKVSATHNELSRILSEHGIFGLFALMILVFAPLVIRIRNKSNIYFYAFLIFWFLTINHSSMRIAAPAFIYGLALINVVNGQKKNRILRK
ncbi:O-antigen ligase family protein [Aureitalea sp. L0-47]|nr:O-antigen ligase family protein [Aureitalea sp. L0-47]